MYIYALSNHIEEPKIALSDKKKLLKKRVNRADNFINLTLLGVQKALEEIDIKRETNLYIASDNGNINTTSKVFDSIFKKEQLPMPFNFLNSVNASILFFVAKNINIEGKTLFVDRFESALTQAFVDIKNGKDVLVGEVTEAFSDLNIHREKFKSEKIQESSRWLLISPTKKREKPIAKIHEITLSNKNNIENIEDLFLFLEKRRGNFQYNGKNLSFKLEKLQ